MEGGMNGRGDYRRKYQAEPTRQDLYIRNMQLTEPPNMLIRFYGYQSRRVTPYSLWEAGPASILRAVTQRDRHGSPQKT